VSAGQQDALLQVCGVDKSFGPTLALQDVSLEAHAGQVHAVLGENGAGKSTLMKILAGAQRPDRGTMRLGGAAFAPLDPLAARAAGVAIVYQEPQLCDHLSVADNIALGIELCRWGLVDRAATRKRTEEVLGQLGGEEQSEGLEPGQLVGALGSGARQLVAIARALVQSDCKVLILDEPTSSLGAADVERLFATIDRLRAAGVCILYISHFLEEVERIADRYTVLRDGRGVGSGSMQQTSVEQLITLMVGREVGSLWSRTEREPGEVMLQIEHLVGLGLPRRASLELRAGQVLGIAGLVGSGRTELLRTIFGLAPVVSGRIEVGAFVGPASPTQRLAQGVGMLSEDRKAEGLAATMSLADNMTLSRLRGLGPAGWISPRRQEAAAARWIERLSIRCRDAAQAVADLSGGNQQKVALARLLHHDVDVLLLDEPTRGIDVASRSEIYRVIEELAAAGKAVLVISSYLPELLGICDQVAVMRRGRLGVARDVAELDQQSLLTEATST